MNARAHRWRWCTDRVQSCAVYRLYGSDPLLPSSSPAYSNTLLVLPVSRRRAAGGPDAPDLTESLTNLGINTAAVAVLSWLVWRDVSSKQAELRVTTREEGLGRLQVRVCVCVWMGGCGGACKMGCGISVPS